MWPVEGVNIGSPAATDSSFVRDVTVESYSPSKVRSKMFKNITGTYHSTSKHVAY